ncbi:hypothetical protein [Nostoc sp. FACHB-888]|uniref:hypothetical protein n=1 Tax=Nostoc sp. FACHB-888 TaxID=2692842 RepID=UPI0016864FC4|nr:hypothetical protein [Nostoc sp. FACHB-888]MBD2248945.1 hypothetical protein [Nostoc sp. FACHB-888]
MILPPQSRGDLTERQWKRLMPTVGERHEAVVFEQLMSQGAVKRPSVGRPRLRPKRLQHFWQL